MPMLRRSPEYERQRTRDEDQARLYRFLGAAAPVAGGAVGAIGGGVAGGLLGGLPGATLGASLGGLGGGGAGTLAQLFLEEQAAGKTDPHTQKDLTDLERLQAIRDGLDRFKRY